MISFDASHRFLVTGASSGIGRGIALLLVELGATVIGVGRDRARLEQLRSVCACPERFHVETRDLSAGELAAWLEQLTTRHGPFRGLALAAGRLESAPLKVVSTQSAKRLFALNFDAALALAQGFARQHDEHAALVVISSDSALRGLAGTVSYSASKEALDAALRSMAAELAPEGVRCNAILPGIVHTALLDAVPEEQLRYLRSQQFLEGTLEPADIAWACAFLLSDSARFITGESLMVDGGAGVNTRLAHGVSA